MTSERHEAAHAAAFRWQGVWDLDTVSVRSGAGHLGVTMLRDGRAWPSPVRFDVTNPHDPTERRLVDSTIVALLAGQAAEYMAGPSATGWSPIPSGPPSFAAPVISDRLLEAEANPAPKTDADLAWDLAYGLVGDVAPLYLDWLYAEAVRFVADHAPAINALAAALVRERLIDGARAAAILDTHERETDRMKLPGSAPKDPQYQVDAPTPGLVYVCMSGYVSATGSFPAGARVRAPHPALTAHPQFWIVEGATDDEEQATWGARFGLNAIRPR